MPSSLRQIRTAVGSAVEVVVGILNLPSLDRSSFANDHLLRGLTPVGPRNHWRPTVKLTRKPRGLDIDLGVVHSVSRGGVCHRRFHPFKKIGRPVIALRKNPCSVLNMNDVRRPSVLVHEILDGNSRIGPVVHHTWRVPVPRRRSSSPRIVPIRGGHHQTRPTGIVGIRSHIAVDQTLLPT